MYVRSVERQTQDRKGRDQEHKINLPNTLNINIIQILSVNNYYMYLNRFSIFNLCYLNPQIMKFRPEFLKLWNLDTSSKLG